MEASDTVTPQARPGVVADYEIVRLLGEGVGGRYFLARPPARLGLAEEFVALKVFADRVGEEAYDRGVRELRAFAAVRSPFLVRVFDAVLEDTFVYAMEYYPLGSLAGRVPPGKHRCHLDHHPVADLVDDPGLLGNADEVVGRDHAAGRMLPAQQGLGPGHSARREAELGLQGEHELAALNRVRQRLFGVHAMLVLGGQGIAEQAVLMPAARLRTVHGDVGRAHQFLDRAPVPGP